MSERQIELALPRIIETIYAAPTENSDYEPYFGYCNVEGCMNEGCSGGMAWKESGYWTVCDKHAQEYRDGNPQPPMKAWAVYRENSRLPDGTLPPGL